jgi:glycerol kinase
VCTTVAWQVDGAPALAAEANIRSAGRTLTWLADLLGVPVDVLVAEAEAASAEGVVLVPAFGGLGAPWWDVSATPLLAGFALGTRREQLSRAALESVAFQVDDVLGAFRASGTPVSVLAADGGLTMSSALMQLQADLSGVPVRCSTTSNLSALGVASLAGLVLGWWSRGDLEARADESGGDVFTPAATDEAQAALRARWALARNRSRGG